MWEILAGLRGGAGGAGAARTSYSTVQTGRVGAEYLVQLCECGGLDCQDVAPARRHQARSAGVAVPGGAVGGQVSHAPATHVYTSLHRAQYYSTVQRWSVT